MRREKKTLTRYSLYYCSTSCSRSKIDRMLPPVKFNSISVVFVCDLHSTFCVLLRTPFRLKYFAEYYTECICFLRS